jgi:ATP adenylyltransferase
VQHQSDSHTLLLNKFNVVPHHVLVVTRQFESQQDPLNARDLAATQQVGCMCAAGSSHHGT